MRPSRPPSSRSNDQASPHRRLFRPRPCADRGRPAIHRPGRLDETARTTRSGRPSSSLVERAYARWQRPPRKKQVMPWPVSLEQRSTGSATSTISSAPATPGRWQRANGGAGRCGYCAIKTECVAISTDQTRLRSSVARIACRALSYESSLMQTSWASRSCAASNGVA